MEKVALFYLAVLSIITGSAYIGLHFHTDRHVHSLFWRMSYSREGTPPSMLIKLKIFWSKGDKSYRVKRKPEFEIFPFV